MILPAVMSDGMLTGTLTLGICCMNSKYLGWQFRRCTVLTPKRAETGKTGNVGKVGWKTYGTMFAPSRECRVT